MATDMYVQGVGKGAPPKKGQPKQESYVIEGDKVIDALKKLAQRRIKYSTVDTKALASIILKDNETFNGLKAEIEAFNEEVRNALLLKKEVDFYPFKMNLYGGLRNLLKEIVATDNPALRTKLLERASNWFYEKLVKKEEGNKINKLDLTKDNHTRPVTALTRPKTSATFQSQMTGTNIS